MKYIAFDEADICLANQADPGFHVTWRIITFPLAHHSSLPRAI
jgi:hypothetical protein